MTNSIETRKH